MSDAENLGTEELHNLAAAPFVDDRSIVIGFNEELGENSFWIITHPTNLVLVEDENKEKILQHLVDRFGLQRDTAIIVTDLHSDRPLVFGCSDPGNEESWSELGAQFVDIR